MDKPMFCLLFDGLKEFKIKAYRKVAKELEPVFKRLPQELSKIATDTSEYMRVWVQGLVYPFSLAIEKALEYIPQEKESLYIQYVEKMLDSVRNTEIEKTPEGFVLRRRKTGEMFGVYDSRKNRLFIMK